LKPIEVTQLFSRSFRAKNLECKDDGFVSEAIINTILNPTANYFNPLSYVKSDADMDLGLEYLFDLESIGIKCDNDLSTEDQV
jgi:hypothetical protein